MSRRPTLNPLSADLARIVAGVGVGALLVFGAPTTSMSQDPPEIQRLPRDASPSPDNAALATDGQSSIKVRRISRVPREPVLPEGPDAHPSGFNRPPEPTEQDAEAAEAQRVEGAEEEHDAHEEHAHEEHEVVAGDAMETTSDSDAGATHDEADQLIASAVGEAVTRGRVLAREEAKEENKKIPAHFVFRPPMRNRKITSRYGLRYHPLDKRRKGRKRRKKKMHKGIDYGAPKGTPILATGPGKVIHSGWGSRGKKSPNGLCVFIKHPNGWVSIYLHMSKIDVKEGDVVSSRQQIGRVGSTGRSTGPHLHFQVQKKGHTIDPQKIFGKRSDKIKSP